MTETEAHKELEKIAQELNGTLQLLIVANSYSERNKRYVIDFDHTTTTEND